MSAVSFYVNTRLWVKDKSDFGRLGFSACIYGSKCIIEKGRKTVMPLCIRRAASDYRGIQNVSGGCSTLDEENTVFDHVRRHEVPKLQVLDPFSHTITS